MLKNLFSSTISPQNYSDVNGIIAQNPSIPVITYASSVQGDDNTTYGSQNAISVSILNHWRSKDANGEWIVINFSSLNIFATHYGVRTVDYGPGNGHPKQWVTHGYYFGEWVLVDVVTSSLLNGNYNNETRAFQNNGPFSAFRLTSTGSNWGAAGTSFFFRFSRIDFFGSILSPSFDIRKYCSNLVLRPSSWVQFANFIITGLIS